MIPEKEKLFTHGVVEQKSYEEGIIFSFSPFLIRITEENMDKSL